MVLQSSTDENHGAAPAEIERLTQELHRQRVMVSDSGLYVEHFLQRFHRLHEVRNAP
jgi:hypothetical protein